MTLTISQLCFILITITFIILAVYLVMNLKKMYEIQKNILNITVSVNKKVETVDEFLEGLKELEGIFKYAKTGIKLVKSLKKEEKKEVKSNKEDK